MDLNDRDIATVTKLLLTTELTLEEIAQRMRCSRSCIASWNRRLKIRQYNGKRTSWAVIK